MPPRRDLSEKLSCAFTLIELLVVIVILGILIAVAVPTFLVQQQKAQDNASEQSLVTAFRSARAASVGNNGASYPPAASVAAEVALDQPQLSVLVGHRADSSRPNQIVVDSSSTSSTVILWNRSLSGHSLKLVASSAGAPVVTAVSSYQQAVLADGPSGYWQLNEPSGSSAADSAGSDNGTHVNGPTLAAAAPFASFGKAVRYANGTSQYTDLPLTLDPASSDVSVEAWVRWDGTNPAAHHTAVAQFDGTGSTGRNWILIYGGGSPQWGSYVGGFLTPISTVPDTNWHDIVVTHDHLTNQLKIYFDGVLAKTATVTAEASDGDWMIGNGKQLTTPMSGTVDEVSIYPRVLAAGEVSDHYARGR